MPTNLSATYTNSNSILNWTGLEGNQSLELHYAIEPNYSGWNADEDTPGTFWGQRYPATSIAHFADMEISKISCYLYYASNYTLYAFNGEVAETDKLCERSYSKANEDMEWIDFNFDTPLQIDCSKDLWLVLYNNDPDALYPALSGYYSGDNDSEGKYLASTLEDLPTNICDAQDMSWLFVTTLTDGTYTYNLYDNSVSVANDIAATSYSVANPATNSIHQYTVKTNYYGGESAASNVAGLALGTTTINHDFSLNANDKMTVAENSSLTVTGTLSNANPENLIIENGAQLIHNSTGVKATVKKVIDPTIGNNQGWNFIASPVVESIEPSQNNGLLSGIYDLYLYEEPTYMWRNYKEHIVDNINQNTASGFHLNYKQGYLYANSTSDTLQFSGTLAPSDSTVSINNLSHSASILTGFNLVGNPYAHNVTSYTGNNVAAECYRMNENRSNIIVSTIDKYKPLLPAEGFFVKATNENASITFNSSSRNETTQPASIQLNLISDSLTFDRLIVKCEGEPLEKLSLRESGTKIFAMKGNQESAVAIAEGNEQAVSFKAEKNGIFTLRAKVEPKEWKYLHLIDNMTGADIDLLATPEYSFEARTDDYVSRFKLVFFAPEDVYDDAPFAYISNGEIRILGKNQDFKSLQIMDMTGRIVINRDVASNVSTTGLSAGVYVLRLINDNQVKTQKVLVP